MVVQAVDLQASDATPGQSLWITASAASRMESRVQAICQRSWTSHNEASSASLLSQQQRTSSTAARCLSCILPCLTVPTISGKHFSLNDDRNQTLAYVIVSAPPPTLFVCGFYFLLTPLDLESI